MMSVDTVIPPGKTGTQGASQYGTVYILIESIYDGIEPTDFFKLGILSLKAHCAFFLLIVKFVQ